MNIFMQIAEYMSYPFVRYALVAGVLVALCSSLLGVILVLKRYSFIGDGLSHVAFGAMAIAAVLSVSNEMIVVMPTTILCAVILLKRGQNTGVNGDAALAMFSVGAMAVGYLLLNTFSTSANIAGDVCSTLFGSTSILTLERTDVILCVVMSIVVIAVFVFLYNKIFAVTFDETFSKATGVNTDFYNLLIALITAVIIVLAMSMVGALLTSALIVFPALSAMQVIKSFRGVIICSAVISVAAALAGILASILFSTPVGATIVVANIVIFAGFYICGTR
ncbi:MAG: metal ABC transporter permease [Firmicutes bacterium]|nr:metal ABC transporter permease [Bacillota bacterium]